MMFLPVSVLTVRDDKVCDPVLEAVPALGHDGGHLGLHAEVDEDPLALLEMLGAPGPAPVGVQAGILHGAVGVRAPRYYAASRQLPVLYLTYRKEYGSWMTLNGSGSGSSPLENMDPSPTFKKKLDPNPHPHKNRILILPDKT